MKILPLLSTLLFLPLAIANCATAVSRPNILLFLADNWSWPHASALGDPTARTPVFDRIAKEGVLFTQTFCPVPSCSPTRSCMLTGRAAHQLEDAASLWSAFPRKLVVFTQALREAGYEVGYSGKGWSPGRFLEYGWPENPIGKQFQDFDEFLTHRDPVKPFFFWNGNTDTAMHKWRYAQDAGSSLDPKSLRIPAELPDSPTVQDTLLAYYASVGRMDEDAGRVIGALEQKKLLDETVVIYTSDNGWQMPRGLANCYDSGTRVPLAIRWGNKLQAGRKAEEFISLTDFAPTFLEIAGAKPPADMTESVFSTSCSRVLLLPRATMSSSNVNATRMFGAEI